MWRSRRRMEHANSRSLCKLVSSFHPSLNLFTWNLKRGRKVFTFAFCSSEQFQCERTCNAWLHALLLIFATQMVKSFVVRIETGGHTPLCTVFPGHLTNFIPLSGCQCSTLIPLGCFCKETLALQQQCQQQDLQC